jgi:hypothetical protein
MPGATVGCVSVRGKGQPWVSPQGEGRSHLSHHTGRDFPSLDKNAVELQYLTAAPAAAALNPKILGAGQILDPSSDASLMSAAAASPIEISSCARAEEQRGVRMEEGGGGVRRREEPAAEEGAHTPHIWKVACSCLPGTVCTYILYLHRRQHAARDCDSTGPSILDASGSHDLPPCNANGRF